MTISPIKQLQQLGKMPNEDLDNDGTDTHNLVAQYETLLNEIEEPISFEDAYVLLSILPDTKCYGLEEIIEGKIESIELDNEETIEAYDKLINSCNNKEVKDFLIVGFENWKEEQ